MARCGNLSNSWPADSSTSAHLDRARCQRTYGASLGNNFSGTIMLTEFNAFIASLLSAGAVFAMPRFNSFPVWAIIAIVVNISVFGGIFLRVRIVRSHFSHFRILSLHFLAMFAEPIPAICIDSLTSRNVAPRATILVIVINATRSGLFVRFVYRVIDSSRHRSRTPFVKLRMSPLISYLLSAAQ